MKSTKRKKPFYSFPVKKKKKKVKVKEDHNLKENGEKDKSEK